MPQVQELPTVPAGHLPPLLTVPEVAALLRVDASTVYRAVRRGELPAVRLGGRGTSVRIPASALEELLSPASVSARRRAGQAPVPPRRAAGSSGSTNPKEAA
jgi:excisionase family DNA binding protein